MKPHWPQLSTVCLVLGACLGASPLDAAQTEVLPTGVPWRIYATSWNLDKRSGELVSVGTAPPTGWTSPEFDDSTWGRYSKELDEAIGGYGCEQSIDLALLSLRTCFGVDDPAAATDLALTVEYRGGVVILVNGTEVARRDLPAGDLTAKDFATAYPDKVLKGPDGKHLPRSKRPATKQLAEYEQRIRHAQFSIPAAALRKGGNVLAIEIHAAPINGMNRQSRDAWSTVGLCNATVTSPSGRGVTAYAKALEEPTVWNATPMDTVANASGTFQHGFLWWGLTVTPIGLTRGNPFEVLRPIRAVAPRGGTCSGQVVVSDAKPFNGLKATISPLQLAGGNETIPADQVQVCYASQRPGEMFCNALNAAPVDGASVQPVWVLVDVPRDQAPGWYTSTLKLSLGERTWNVPVQVLVSPWILTDPRDNATLISMYQSPETLVGHYKVEPWSDEHFRLIEKSFACMAGMGNDVLLVPIINDTYLGHQNGMVRWVKRGGEYAPEYSLLERYLDSYIKHCGKPKIITLMLWKHDFGCRTWFRGMENKTVGPCMVTAVDPATGKMTPMEAPHYGRPGSEAFWKTMIAGVRGVLAKRGCEGELLLGEFFDSRPLQPVVDFFKQIEPGMRWQGYSHWEKEPKPEKGGFICQGGFEVGFKIGPNGGGLDELYTRNRTPKKGEETTPPTFLMAQAERTSYQFTSSPLSYRCVLYSDDDGGGTLARVGLDFWQIPDPKHPGRFTSLYGCPPKEGWLWRGHVPNLTAPGPDGAVRTSRGQMLLEGLQETEAMVALIQAAKTASPELAVRVKQCCDRRSAVKGIGSALSQAAISIDLNALAAGEYTLVAELAGQTAANLWNTPPPTTPTGGR